MVVRDAVGESFFKNTTAQEEEVLLQEAQEASKQIQQAWDIWGFLLQRGLVFFLRSELGGDFWVDKVWDMDDWCFWCRGPWGLTIRSPWIPGIPRWSGASIYYLQFFSKIRWNLHEIYIPWVANLLFVSVSFDVLIMFWSCFPMMCWSITPWVNQASAQRIATCAEKTQETQGDRPLGLLMGWVMGDGWMVDAWDLGSGIYIYIFHVYVYIYIYTYF